MSRLGGRSGRAVAGLRGASDWAVLDPTQAVERPAAAAAAVAALSTRAALAVAVAGVPPWSARWSDVWRCDPIFGCAAGPSAAWTFASTWIFAAGASSGKAS